jgi:hypothetical protein
MFPTVYVVFTEQGRAYDVYMNKDIANRMARAFTLRDNESYTVQEYAPTRTVLTTIPVPHKNDSLPSPYLYGSKNKNNRVL